MLVEFSPWQTADTSLRLSMPHRKRRREGATALNGNRNNNKQIRKEEEEPFLSLTGSFITKKSGRRKKGSSIEGSHAAFAITSPHRVSVLVENSKAVAHTNTSSNTIDSACSLIESEKLQYSSRPGNATAFLNDNCKYQSQKHSEEIHAKEPTPAKIPVIFDAKNDRLFGLQSGNKRLVFWDAQTEGPDANSAKGSNKDDRSDAKASEEHRSDGGCSTFHDLPSRARCLHLLPNDYHCIVIGSLESGGLFYAFVDSANSDIQVRYIQENRKEQEKHAERSQHYVGAFVTLNCNSSSFGRKRKTTKEGTGQPPSLEMYQVFVQGVRAIIKCHDLVVSVDEAKNEPFIEYHKCRTAVISMLPPGLDELSSSSLVMKGTSILPTTIRNAETATLYFRLEHTHASSVPKVTASETDIFNAGDTHYCCTIDLQSATLVNPPFAVPCGPQHLALTSPRLLAVGTCGSILLCDSFNGVVLHSGRLPSIVHAMKHDWVLLSDARKGHLLILYIDQDGLVKFTTTTVVVESEAVGEGSSHSLLLTSKLSLAERLSAALNTPHQQQKLHARVPNLLTLVDETTGETEDSMVEKEVRKAVTSVREKVSHILQRFGFKSGMLVDTYDEAVSNLLQAIKKTESCLKRPERTDGVSDKNDAEMLHELVDAGNETSSTKGTPLSEGINGVHEEFKNGKQEVSLPDSQNGLKEVSDRNEMISIPQENAENEESNVRPPREEEGAASKTRDEMLPFSFIDGVTPIVVRLLLEVKSHPELSTKISTMIRQDCSVVLSHLVATGKVSARRHLGGNEQDTALVTPQDFLKKVLLCLDLKQTKERRLRSPIEFMNDMLRYCADVSESQMVTMLSYHFRRSCPADIALAFHDSKSLPKDHPYKKLSRCHLKYMQQLDNAPPGTLKADLNKKLEKTSSKLIIAGSAALLERVLLYANCNQTLLCSALRDELSFGYETGLLSRLLSELAFVRSKKFLSITNDAAAATAPNGVGHVKKKKNIVASVAQWIPALLDAFKGEIKGSDATGEHSHDLLRLRQSLAVARRQTELLMTLEYKVNDATFFVGDGTSHKRRKVSGEHQNSLPAYSVERLVF